MLIARIMHAFFQTLADSAIQGVILGIALAFPLLVMATMNIILGTMATISIGLTTACVIGVIPIAGWKLGVSVFLNLDGLATCDYTLYYVCLLCNDVPLANVAYIDSRYSSGEIG